MENRLQELLNKAGRDLPDLLTREVTAAGKKISIVHYKSMTEKQMLVSGVLNPLSQLKGGTKISLDYLSAQVITLPEIQIISKLEDMIERLTQNDALLFLEGEEQCLALALEAYPSRIPAEPPTSAVIRGPREGFVEDWKINLTLLRRRFKTEKFCFEAMDVGRQTKNKVVLMYLKNIAHPTVLSKIRKRIQAVDIDGLVDSNQLLPFLEENPRSIFKQAGVSEKPDIVAAKMLEGRVAIVVDGSPMVLTLPFVGLEDFQASNDYYIRSNYVTFIRLVRLIGIFIAVILPGFYLCLRLYHASILPVTFLITVTNATQVVPFTPFAEILFVIILFQLLYEVSLRLPSYLGLATSIVGGLILGDTGVKAGLISPPTVLIVALSMFAVYVIPDQSDQLNLLRFVFLILGGGLGLLGMVAGFLFLTCYLNTLNSYGAPYLAPFSPLVEDDKKDAVFFTSLTERTKRPKSFPNRNRRRLAVDKSKHKHGEK